MLSARRSARARRVGNRASLDVMLQPSLQTRVRRRSPKRQIRSHRAITYRQTKAPVRAQMSRDHRQTTPDAAAPAVSQQPEHAVDTLPNADGPQRNRITQVRKQREVRDTPRGYLRLGVSLQV